MRGDVKPTLAETMKFCLGVWFTSDSDVVFQRELSRTDDLLADHNKCYLLWCALPTERRGGVWRRNCTWGAGRHVRVLKII